jgi:hypothetical protein
VYTVTEHYIIPLTPNGEQPLLRTIIDLILPFMVRLSHAPPLALPQSQPSSYVISYCFTSFLVRLVENQSNIGLRPVSSSLL